MLAAIYREIQSHDFSSCVDDPPSVAQGGKGIVFPGCMNCRIQINTLSKFLTIWQMTRCPRYSIRSPHRASTDILLFEAHVVLG
jgi:hypothetical protein